MKIIDITGNWADGVRHEGCLQVSEPDVAPGKPRTFHQRLLLPSGNYAIELDYNSWHDRAPAFALEGKDRQFDGLRVDGKPLPLAWKGGEDPSFLSGRAEFTTANDGGVELEMTLMSTRPLVTRLVVEAGLPVSTRFRAVAPEGEGCVVVAHGIPFRLSAIDRQYGGAWLDLKTRTGLRPWADEGWTLDCGDAAARRIHVAGMVSTVDVANGSWYSKKGDNGYSHFVGDRAGTIRVDWTEGGSEEIPLLYGLNFWYGKPWDIFWHYTPYGRGSWMLDQYNYDKDIFGGDPAPMRQIRDTVRLVDGERGLGGVLSSTRYILSLDLGGRRVRRLQISGTPEMHGYPYIGGITVETADAGDALLPLPGVSEAEPAVRAVTPAELRAPARATELAALQRLLYATADDWPDLKSP